MKYFVLSLLFLTACSDFNLKELEIQGVKKDTSKVPDIPVAPPDPRLRLIGRYKFVGANIERATGELVKIRSCPKDSLFIDLNDFEGLALTFREKGQYFYEGMFFINKKPPTNWIAEEDLRATMVDNRIDQYRKRIRYERGEKVYIEYNTSLERVDDLLFYNSKVTLYRPHRYFKNELVPKQVGQLQCAYGFDSLTDTQKKAHARDMGYTVKPKYKILD